MGLGAGAASADPPVHAPVDHAAGDALRSDLIFLGASGSAVTNRAYDQDVVVLRTPDNPGFWWGNTWHFERAPVEGDVERWPRLFDECIAAVQPCSRHRTFAWSGVDRGLVEPFVALGYDYLETSVLAADREATIVAPHVDRSVRVTRLAAGDWDALHDLLLATRDASQESLDTYSDFARGRIAVWRTLAERGQGHWLAARAGDGRGPLLAALGIFVESQVGKDGRRIGRYQHVVTRVDARRRGLAGMLVAEAARIAFDELAADSLLILADESGVARRVYEATGFTPAGWKRGLERRPPLA